MPGPADILAMVRPGGGAPAPGGAMPGMPGAPGGAPPPAPGQSNVGPVTTAQPGHGTGAAATQALGVALKALQQALPAIPLGSELHTKVLRLTTDLSKELNAAHDDPQLQTQQLMQMIRQISSQAPNAMLAKLQPTAPMTPPAMAGAPPAAPSPAPSPAGLAEAA